MRCGDRIQLAVLDTLIIFAILYRKDLQQANSFFGIGELIIQEIVRRMTAVDRWSTNVLNRQ
jgi:hypothetical protein